MSAKMLRRSRETSARTKSIAEVSRRYGDEDITTKAHSVESWKQETSVYVDGDKCNEHRFLHHERLGARCPEQPHGPHEEEAGSKTTRNWQTGGRSCWCRWIKTRSDRVELYSRVTDDEFSRREQA